MDRFFSPHMPETLAHAYITENKPSWQLDHTSVDETLIAGCASYCAFDRYLGGADLFLPPRTRKELESILRRYSCDAIHNTIATTRAPLKPGGYSRVCHLAEKSIKNVLDIGDNAKVLISLHSSARHEAKYHRKQLMTVAT